MPTGNESVSRTRRKAGSVLITLGAVLLLASGAAKLAHVPPVVAQLSAMGFDGGKLTFVGLLEVFSAALFLIPATRSAGLLFVSSFLGGAIATHLQHAEPIAGPSVILSLLWFAAWLRHPQIFWSWPLTRSASPAAASRRVPHIADGF